MALRYNYGQYKRGPVDMRKHPHGKWVKYYSVNEALCIVARLADIDKVVQPEFRPLVQRAKIFRDGDRSKIYMLFRTPLGVLEWMKYSDVAEALNIVDALARQHIIPNWHIQPELRPLTRRAKIFKGEY